MKLWSNNDVTLITQLVNSNSVAEHSRVTRCRGFRSGLTQRPPCSHPIIDDSHVNFVTGIDSRSRTVAGGDCAAINCGAWTDCGEKGDGAGSESTDRYAIGSGVCEDERDRCCDGIRSGTLSSGSTHAVSSRRTVMIDLREYRNAVNRTQ